MEKPTLKPKRSHFSCGPCVKFPGWNPSLLESALVGRSHRSPEGKQRLKDLTDRLQSTLRIPDSHHIAIMAGSTTGAFEAALWNLLGPRTVDILTWDVFGEMWRFDIVEQLKVPHRVFDAPYGSMPDLSQIDWSHDVVLTWNATSAGVRVPNDPWIAEKRDGLILVDATSTVFAEPLPWESLDVVAFSWQKGLGSEGGHGVLVVGPRAMKRLEEYVPAWPIPRIYRLKREQAIVDSIYRGETINTPSMLCVEDALIALRWIESIGGIDTMYQRCQDNFDAWEDWVQRHPWVEFLAKDPACRSKTSIALQIIAPWFVALPTTQQTEVIKAIAALLGKEEVAVDIVNHFAAPPSLRLWGGGTVDKEDTLAVQPWVVWAYEHVKETYSKI